MKLNRRNRLVAGVGINDAEYNVQIGGYKDGKETKIWRCPHYITWTNMLDRCYSEKYQSKYPTYRGCTVCDEWLVFSNFKAWMEKQDWEGKQLDKDLLKDGNKVYSPEYCIFVNRKINYFVLDCRASRGKYMLGVCWDKHENKYYSQCQNPFSKKKEYLGRYTDELEAHLAWKKRKHELSCMLADSELVSDPRLAEALRTRYL